MAYFEGRLAISTEGIGRQEGGKGGGEASGAGAKTVGTCCRTLIGLMKMTSHFHVFLLVNHDKCDGATSIGPQDHVGTKIMPTRV